MSLFSVCVDFFNKGRRILLTKKGLEKVWENKLTGTKLPYFFEIKDEWCYVPKNEPKTLFHKWKKITSFSTYPEVIKNDKYEEEQEIRNYLNKHMGRNFNGYSSYTFNVFYGKFLGGVPDGEEFEKDVYPPNHITTLEIKQITQEAFARKIPFINHLLQLSLYLYLRKGNWGYLCLYSGFPDTSNPLKKELDTPDSEWQTHELSMWIADNEKFNYSFRVLEKWENASRNICVYKVEIDMDLFEKLVLKANESFVNLSHVSPELEGKEKVFTGSIAFARKNNGQ